MTKKLINCFGGPCFGPSMNASFKNPELARVMTYDDETVKINCRRHGGRGCYDSEVDYRSKCTFEKEI